MKLVVLLVVLGIAIASPLSLMADNSIEKNVDTVSELSLSRQGWVDYKYCVGECAALGDPYRYNVYSASDISDSALKAIQDLGFSMNPAGVSYRFKNCLSIDQKQVDSENSKLIYFWTDYIYLTDALLNSMQLNWNDLGVTPSDHLAYQIQLMGCYYTENDGGNTPFTDPGMARAPGVLSRSAYETSVRLIMTLYMQKRAQKSSFISVENSVYPKKILDHIRNQMGAFVSSVNAESYPSDSAGNVLY